MNWVEESIREYYSWLKSNTFVNEDKQTGWVTISTPFLGLFNDNIEIYAKKINDRIELNDDGQTIKNLDLLGVSVKSSAKRKELLDFILTNYGITVQGEELSVKCSLADFAQKKHNIISAISEISDLEVMAKHTIASVFHEDVKSFLDEQQIIYTPQFIAKGSTGIEFTFDFQIAGREKEIVLKSFNTVNKMNVPNFLFAWDDIKATREKVTKKQLKGLAIVNDIDNSAKSEYLEALRSKGSEVILWSQRHQPDNIRKLAA